MKKLMRNFLDDLIHDVGGVAVVVVVIGGLLLAAILIFHTHPASRPPATPARFEILGQKDYGTQDDPSNYISIICDHQTGVIVYANGRGGIVTYAGNDLTCAIIPSSR
jgi:hypothetical protein